MKTKLGISTGLLAAAMYLTGLFSGYTVLTMIAGYVLIVEEDTWLKQSAVKAFAVCLSFSVLSALVGFIPNVISLIDSIATIFSGSFYIPALSGIVNLLQTALSIAEKILLLLLAFNAMKNRTIKLSFVDNLLAGQFGERAASAPETKGTKFCSHCGETISSETVFCPQCGKKC